MAKKDYGPSLHEMRENRLAEDYAAKVERRIEEVMSAGLILLLSFPIGIATLADELIKYQKA